MPTTRVVTVSYGSAAVLPAFLDSLATATAESVEVVVVDNGSTDGGPEQAAARGAEVRRMAGNLGYGAAANHGVAGAVTDWVVVTNPDITWDTGALDELLAAAARHPEAGALGPAIITPQGQLYPSARAFPSIARGVGHALCGWWWPSNPWTAAYRRESGTPTEGPTGWLSGSCLLLRRAAFEAVGGFDESYFMYCEDMDLCRRLADAGWANVYVPSARVTHQGAHSTRRNPRAMAAAHHRSLYRYLARQYPGRRYAPLRAVLAVGLVARTLLVAVLPRVAEGAEPTREAEALDQG